MAETSFHTIQTSIVSALNTCHISCQKTLCIEHQDANQLHQKENMRTDIRTFRFAFFLQLYRLNGILFSNRLLEMNILKI